MSGLVGRASLTWTGLVEQYFRTSETQSGKSHEKIIKIRKIQELSQKKDQTKFRSIIIFYNYLQLFRLSIVFQSPIRNSHALTSYLPALSQHIHPWFFGHTIGYAVMLKFKHLQIFILQLDILIILHINNVNIWKSKQT